MGKITWDAIFCLNHINDWPGNCIVNDDNEWVHKGGCKALQPFFKGSIDLIFFREKKNKRHCNCCIDYNILEVE